MDRNRLEYMRQQYPVGSRIKLTEMKDPYNPVPPGTMGTLVCIDDIGTFHVKWDNGRTLGLVMGEDTFDIQRAQTEEERFGPKIAEGLPELCFSVLPGSGELICIKRGESGYYRSDWSTDDRKQNQELADYNNEKLGVTPAQRMAMETGSMHGWEVPGADPASYQKPDSPQMGGMEFG